MNSFFKPLLWLWLCFAFSAAFAQESAYRQAADQAFTNLDKTGVSSKILYDRVFPAASLTDYSVSGSGISSSTHFLQARDELRQASYDPGTHLITNELRALIWQSSQQNIVPIGIISARFQMVRFENLNLNNDRYGLKDNLKVAVNEKEAQSQSQALAALLYSNKQAVVVSVLVPQIPQGTSIFQIPDWAVLSNRGLGITDGVVNFGDGNPTQTLIAGNNTVQATYSTGGEKTIQFTVRFANGTQHNTSATVQVSEVSALTRQYPITENGFTIDSLRFLSSIPFQGVNLTNYLLLRDREMYSPITPKTGILSGSQSSFLMDLMRAISEVQQKFIKKNYNTSLHLGERLIWEKNLSMILPAIATIYSFSTFHGISMRNNPSRFVKS